VSDDEYGDSGQTSQEQESLRTRSEQAIGEIAQALIDNPTLHNAIAAAFGAREKAIEAQHAAMSALNLPSASDVERLERRLRSFSQRLEEVEEQLDDANRENSVLRRRLSAQATQLEELEAKSEELRAKAERKPAKKEKAAAAKD
jgi:predicted RNase H-like nuclease (RuvC/YqgF family)